MNLQCSLNKPDVKVTWYKDGQKIVPSKNLKVRVSTYTHQLVFTEVTLKDAGVYKCVAGDVSTEATLTVEGAWNQHEI